MERASANGKYAARYTDKTGKRREKHFDTLPEYEEKHGILIANPDMSMDTWLEYWTTNLICDLAPNILRNDRERYKQNIHPVIGQMKLSDANPCTAKSF